MSVDLYQFVGRIADFRGPRRPKVSKPTHLILDVRAGVDVLYGIAIVIHVEAFSIKSCQKCKFKLRLREFEQRIFLY